jgi:5-methylthioadenosine/S-adenosylhomocysteine deaminase
MLIKNAKYILTEQGVLSGDILVENNRIKQIGGKINADSEEIDATDCIVSPGFVNLHTHAAMTLLRGFADDLPLKTWLEKHIWPAEAKLTPTDIYHGTKLACHEMLQSGTTAFCDMYFHSEEIAKAATESNIRALIAEVIFDFKDKSKTEAEIRKVERTTRLKANELVRFAIGPHAYYTCSEELLKHVRDISKKENLPIHIHLCESESEKGHGLALEKLGFLNSKVIAAHCVQLSNEEIAVLSKRGVSIAHCPVSNLKIGLGVAPVPAMKKSGMQIGLGTDGACSNNALNMLNEAKFSALIQKGFNRNPELITAKEAWEMLTVNGAKALGLDYSMKPGSDADLVVVRLDKNLVPTYNPYSSLVYAADPSNIKYTIVNGSVSYDGKQENKDLKENVLNISKKFLEK